MASLKHEMLDIDPPIFNPLWMIFRLISQSDIELQPCLEASREMGLFPEAAPLVSAALAQSDLDKNELLALLEDSQVRPFIIQNAITSTTTDKHFVSIAESIRAEDLTDLYLDVRAGAVQSSIARRLLEHSDVGVRSVTAAAILLNTTPSSDLPVPVDLLPQWRAALEKLPLPLHVGRRDARHFLARLVDVAPDIYEKLFIRTVMLAPDEGFYKAVQSFADSAQRLSAGTKSRMYAACEQTTPDRRHVFTTLCGNDVHWIEMMLESGAVNADLVDSTLNGLGPAVPVEDLARLLVPRGIEPMRIAMTIQWGSLSFGGDPHERLASFLARMRACAASDDRNVAAVGNAGIQYYEPQLREAQRRYRDNQVRGRW